MATRERKVKTSSDLMSDVSMRSLTREQKKKLLERGNVEIYELVNDETRAFRPWPILRMLKLTTLLRKWFVELLDHLPEATDAQLRTILFEEHPQATLKKFVGNYIQNTMCATSRDIVDELFQDYVNLVKYNQQAMIKAKGDEVKFKMLMGEYMKKNRVFFNYRTFQQIHGMTEVHCEPISPELRNMLKTRRAANERPGVGLMQIAKMDAMLTQHEKMRASQMATKDKSIAQHGGVSSVGWENAKRMS